MSWLRGAKINSVFLQFMTKLMDPNDFREMATFIDPSATQIHNMHMIIKNTEEKLLKDWDQS